MDRLTQLVLTSILVLLLLVGVSIAAQVTIQFDEPTAAGNDCNELRVYYCFGAECTPRTLATRFAASDANCGQLDRQLVFNLDIPQNRVPGQMCFKVTVVNNAGNENTGVVSCVAVTSS